MWVNSFVTVIVLNYYLVYFHSTVGFFFSVQYPPPSLSLFLSLTHWIMSSTGSALLWCFRFEIYSLSAKFTDGWQTPIAWFLPTECAPLILLHPFLPTMCCTNFIIGNNLASVTLFFYNLFINFAHENNSDNRCGSYNLYAIASHWLLYCWSESRQPPQAVTSRAGR